MKNFKWLLRCLSNCIDDGTIYCNVEDSGRNRFDGCMKDWGLYFENVKFQDLLDTQVCSVCQVGNYVHKSGIQGTSQSWVVILSYQGDNIKY